MAQQIITDCGNLTTLQPELCEQPAALALTFYDFLSLWNLCFTLIHVAAVIPVACGPFSPNFFLPLNFPSTCLDTALSEQLAKRASGDVLASCQPHDCVGHNITFLFSKTKNVGFSLAKSCVVNWFGFCIELVKQFVLKCSFLGITVCMSSKVLEFTYFLNNEAFTKAIKPTVKENLTVFINW